MKQKATPLFVVLGACPNSFCSMQAVMFCRLASDVDFWWIKPKESDPSSLEAKTLDYNSAGPYKNNAGKAKAACLPLSPILAMCNIGRRAT